MKNIIRVVDIKEIRPKLNQKKLYNENFKKFLKKILYNLKKLYNFNI